MNRKQLLAAETFHYSYHKYADKLDMNAKRFTKLMPHDIDILENAKNENWSTDQLSKALDVEPKIAVFLQESYERAKEIVDASTPAESFRTGVRHSIQYALEEGLESEDDIEKLVVQICYRAADLSYLLDLHRQKLSRYSEDLRKEPDVGYFNQ